MLKGNSTTGCQKALDTHVFIATVAACHSPVVLDSKQQLSSHEVRADAIISWAGLEQSVLLAAHPAVLHSEAKAVCMMHGPVYSIYCSLLITKRIAEVSSD